MVEINEKKLIEVLYKVKDYLGIGKTEEDVKKYAEKIISVAKERNPVLIPKEGTYYVVVECGKNYHVLAVFSNGEMKCGGWISPLKGDLYVIGRYGYVKFKGEKAEYRENVEIKREGRYEYGLEKCYVSRVHLLVRPREDKIEILDVGVNPVEILTEKEFIEFVKQKRKKREKSFANLWVFLILGITGLSLLFLFLFHPSIQTFFVLSNFSLITFSFLPVLLLIIIFLFLKLKSKRQG